GAGGRHADADLARPLRVAAGHERGHLLVPHLDELGVAVRPVECSDESVDPVAGIAVDAVHAPLAEALEDEVGDHLAHRLLLSRRCLTPGASLVRAQSSTLRDRARSSNGPCAAWLPGTGSKRLSGRSPSSGSSVC